MGQVRDTASFIAAGQARFGDQYDYSHAVYVNASTKIRLYCTRHGGRDQVDVSSQVHLNKKGGCKKCKTESVRARHGKTSAQFIAQAQALFGDRFRYDKVEYVNAKKEVVIHCKKHETDFLQMPDVHLRGSSGCKQCKREAISLSNAAMYEERRVSFSEFVERARVHHGDWYSYDESSYSAFSRDTKITCPKHEIFSQRAQRHADGHGCKKCRSEELRISRSDWRKRTWEKFPHIRVRITQAWCGYDTKVKAKCMAHPELGQWTLTARSLYQGAGCRECERNRKEAPEISALLQSNPDLPGALRTSTNVAFLRFAVAATRKHGRRYRYPEDGFLSFSRPCTVECREHAPFKLFPEDHVLGAGCPTCDQKQKFIARSKENFGIQFDYSKVQFKQAAMSQIVTLGCLQHGTWFAQRAQAHLDGIAKCAPCRVVQKQEAVLARRQERIPELVNEFMAEAKQAHGDKFDYPLLDSELFGWSANITVVCKKHQRTSTPIAAEHLGRYGDEPAGCQSCKGEKARLRLRKSYDEVKHGLGLKGFTLLAEVADYANMRDKVLMRCEDGHENDLVPQKILGGHGCPDCPSYVGEAICRSVLEELFDTRFKKRWFTQKEYPALVAPYHHLEVDGYSPTSQMAFEYQGVYHRLRKVHRKQGDYDRQLARDRATAAVCAELKIALIILDEFRYPFEAEDVRGRINAGLDRAKIDQQYRLTQPIDLSRHIPLVNKSGLKRLRALAKEQHLVALDKQWFGEWHTYNWECKTCAHAFRSPYAVRNAAKHQCCPRCARGKPEVTELIRKTNLARFAPSFLVNLEKRASDLGLKLLDDEWKGSGKEQVYRFRCAFTDGPVIERIYNNLQKYEPGCSCEQHQSLRRTRLEADTGAA